MVAAGEGIAGSRQRQPVEFHLALVLCFSHQCLTVYDVKHLLSFHSFVCIICLHSWQFGD